MADIVTSITDMFSAGTVRLSAYLNSPIPDYLLSISSGDLNTATAIDKAIKIIVLSNVLNSVQGRINLPDEAMSRGTREAAPVFSNLFRPDSSISDDDYNTMVLPLYRRYINLYLTNGGI